MIVICGGFIHIMFHVYYSFKLSRGMSNFECLSTLKCMVVKNEYQFYMTFKLSGLFLRMGDTCVYITACDNPNTFIRIVTNYSRYTGFLLSSKDLFIFFYLGLYVALNTIQIIS